MIKQGPGMLVLPATNLYVGPTYVNAGTLQVTGIMTNSSLTVASDATLTGDGKVGPLTVLSGAGLSPGNGLGRLTSRQTVWSGGGHYLWQLHDASGSPGAGFDVLTVNGTLDVSAVNGFEIQVMTLAGLNPDTAGSALQFNTTNSYSWPLVQTTGGIVGFDVARFKLITDGFLNGTAFGSSFELSVVGNDLVVKFRPPPPPSVLTQVVTGVSSDSGWLNALVNPNGFATGGWFEYGLTTGYGSTTLPTDLGAGADSVPVSSLLNGLSFSKTYHVRFVATNANGLTVGLDRTFTTLPSLPLATTRPAGALTTNSALLRALVDPKGGATIAYFEYGLTSAFGDRTASNSVAANFGQAGVFGGDKQIYLNNVVAGDFTLEFWMRSSQTTDYTGDPFGVVGMVDAQGSQSGFLVGLAEGKLFLTAYGNASRNLDGGFVADGNWHHISVARTRTPGLIVLYVDGLEIARGSGPTDFFNATYIRIGRVQSTLRYYNGDLDDIRFWSVVRSANQIQDSMAAPLSLPQVGLSTYLPLDDSGGNPLHDQSGNNNHAYKDSFFPVSATPGQQAGELGFSALLSNLLPGATYHYRAVAVNSTGIFYGQESSFTTRSIPTLSWPRPASIVFGTSLSANQLNATSSLPGSLVYAPSAGTILGGGNHTLSVTFTPTDTNADPATATTELTVVRASQTVFMDEISDQVYGAGPISLSASASSGLSVSFEVASGPANLSGNNLMITGAGSVTIRASQGGNSDFEPAQVYRSFSVGRATPLVSWGTPADITYGTDLGIEQFNPTASVPGQFQFTPSLGTALLAGTHTLSAIFVPSASENYIAVTSTVSLVVQKASQTIAFGVLPSRVYGGEPVALSATADSGLPVSFHVAGPATLSNSVVFLKEAGLVTVTASQGGNANYLAATNVARTIHVGSAVLTIEANSTNRLYGASVALSGRLTGVLSGDTITANFRTETPTTPSSPVGVYSIGADLVDPENRLSNYSVVTNLGTLTVLPVPLTVSAANAVRVYGATNPVFTGTLGAVSNSDRIIASFKAIGSAVTDSPLSAGSFGGGGTGDGQFNQPRAIAVGPDGTLFISDTFNNRIQHLDAEGNHLAHWGAFGTGPGQFNQPAGLAVDAGTNVYVADQMNSRIQKFDALGTFISEWGSYGFGAGQFSLTFGLALSTQGELYACDFGNGRVHVFDTNGQLLRTWGQYGTGFGELRSPTAIAVSQNGFVYVADLANDRITVHTSEGVAVGQWGAHGSGDGEFWRPLGIALTPWGTVLVADGDNTRVQQFDTSGNFLMKWGQFGSGPGQLRNPAALLPLANRSVLVVDQGNHRVSKYSPALPTAVTSATPVGTYRIVAELADPDARLGNYSVTTTDGVLTIQPRTPVIVWTNPASITYGTALSGAQLQATADVAGRFVYDPTNGTRLPVGQHSLSVSFLPMDEFNFTSSSGAVPLDVIGASQTITFADLPDRVLGDAPFELTATTSSGLLAQFVVLSGPATLASNTLSLTGVGLITVRASQPGNANFTAAPTVERSFTVHGNQTITFPLASTVVYGDGLTLNASSSSGLPVSYELLSGSASLSGNQLMVSNVGSVKVTARQAGDALYYPALAVTQTVTVAKAPLVVTPSNQFRAFGTSNVLDGTIVGLRHGDPITATFAAWGSASSLPHSFAFEFGGLGGADHQFIYPTAAAVDAAGNIWVADTGRLAIKKFSPQGQYLSRFGAYKAGGQGGFEGPTSCVIDRNGDFYVAEEGYHRIQKWDAAGNFLFQIGGEGADPGQFSRVGGLAIDASNNLLAADIQNHRVQKFNSQGQAVGAFGTAGTSNGEFINPIDVAVDREGNVYVADRGNNRVQKFKSDGTFMRTWGSNGSGASQFGVLANVTLDEFGYVYTVENVFNNRIQKFSSDGVFICQWGSGGSGPGQLSQARDIVSSPQGGLVVVDRDNHRVQKFVAAGYAMVTSASEPGVYPILTELTDPASRLGNYQVSVNTAWLTINSPPVVPDQSFVLNEDTPLTLALAASDANGQAFSFLPVMGPMHGNLNGSGTNWSYIPVADYSGSDSFTLVAFDGFNTSSVATVSLTLLPVNDAPRASDRAVTVIEDTPVTIAPPVVDPENDPVTVKLVDGPFYGSVSLLNGNFVYRPSTNFNGFDSFTYQAADVSLTSTVARIFLAISAVQDAPVAVNQAVAAIEDTPVSITVSATSEDSTNLVWTIVNAPAHGTISGAGPEFNYKPATNFYGTDSFGFKANGGLTDSEVATVTISVAPVNDPPVAVGQTLTTDEDTPLHLALLVNDVDSASFSYAITGGPSHGTLAGVAPNLTYIPSTNFSGSDQFTFIANDGASASSPAVVNITITAVNDPPVVQSQSLVTFNNTPVSFTLSALDPEGAEVSFSIVTGPTNGTLSGSAPNLTYHPATNFVGGDSLAYRASDGVELSSPTVVQVTVLSRVAPIVTTQPAVDISGTTALLAATVNPGNASAGMYFEYGPTVQYGATTAVVRLDAGTNGVTTNLTVSGLGLGLTYHYRAVATNSEGTGYGADLTFATVAPGLPWVATFPATFTATAATLNGAVIPYTLVTTAYFEYGTSTNYDRSTPRFEVTGGTDPVAVATSVSNLVAGTIYHCRLVATNSSGVTLGDDISFALPAFAEMISGIRPLSGPSVWGDLDGDGFLDLVIAGYDPNGQAVAVAYRNTGSGFVDMQLGLTALRDGAVALGDYDNDGRLDIFLTGLAPSQTVNTTCRSELWRNTGGGFLKVETDLPGIVGGSAVWGDFDNDGRQDLLLTGGSAVDGFGTGTAFIAQIWRNTGAGFTNLNAGLTPVYRGTAAVADYDRDGYLDIALCGGKGLFRGRPIPQTTEIWRNTGDGRFSKISTGLPEVSLGAVAWGDFDNDGRPDLLVSGWDTSFNFIARVWRNAESGFAEANRALDGTASATTAWADFDSDGSLDVSLTAHYGDPLLPVWRKMNGSQFDARDLGIQAVYWGGFAWGDYDRDGRMDIVTTGLDATYVNASRLWKNLMIQTNTPPNAPTQLRVGGENGQAILSWSAGSDVETPVAGLSYNIRVGTTPGGAEIVSPLSMSSGVRNVVQTGNAQQRLFSHLTNLVNGTVYYWSVQAIDSSMAGSPFAEERSFTMSSQLSVDEPPSVSFVDLVDFASVSNAAMLVTGTAQDDRGVTHVLYQLNGSEWSLATTDNQWTNWSATLHWTPGSNGLAIVAIDTKGQPSLTNVIHVQYVPSSMMTVNVIGQGTVVPNYHNALLALGQSYAMTAQPGLGFAFTNWTDQLGRIASRTQTVSFVMASNLALTANFYRTDLAGPSLSITNVPLGLVVSNSVFTVAGRASDNLGVAAVLYRLNTNDWLLADSANRWTNWTAETELQPGTNTLAAYALDVSGRASVTNSVKIIYVVTGTLTVGTRGKGTITPNYDRRPLALGNRYSMTATPAAGFAFTDWIDGEGTQLTNRPTLNFLMESNRGLFARFSDVAKPTVLLTNLPAGGLVSNGVFEVLGTASDNLAVRSVVYRLNNGDWAPAQTANDWTNWTAALELVPGTNSIAVYAIDTTANVSSTNIAKLVWVPSARLSVGMIGRGTVAPNYHEALLQLGSRYSMTATPAVGFVFTNWMDGDGLPVTNKPALTFQMESNLTFIARFVDITKPTVLVTNYLAGATVTNGTIEVKGTAADNVAVAAVFYRLNDGQWLDATTSNGWTNWSATLETVPGTNVISFYATDAAGNLSSTGALRIVYAVTTPLVVNLVGKGTIAPNLNNRLLQIGNGYSMTATPAAGFVFTNWTNGEGLVLTNRPILSFEMQSNLVVTAQFVDVARPLLAITNAASGMTVTNPVFTLKGKASDNLEVSNVFFAVNESGWQEASASSGWTNWAADLELMAGTNFVSAYAVDTAGNTSLTGQVRIVYAVNSPLIVSSSGRGTIAPNYNGRLLQIGNGYSTTATPAIGFSFTNWTDGDGGIITNKPLLVFMMASNLSFTANFVDISKPTLSITNLVTGGLVSNATFTLRGKATDNVSVSSVFYSLNNSGWNAADTANGWTNWSAGLDLVAGTNSVSAYALDPMGNASSTNVVRFSYIVSDILNVPVSGKGTVSPNYNQALLQIGARYAMTASPGIGFAFTNWTDSDGAVLTNKTMLSFRMSSNLVLRANFVDVAKPTVTVTQPIPLTTPTGEVYVAIGKAVDNAAVDQVRWRLNDQSWNAAQTTNGWTNWTAALELAPGTNWFSVYAIDSSGNASLTNTTRFVYVTAPTGVAGLAAELVSEDSAHSILAFSATTFSQASGYTNNINGVGNYTYTKLSPSSGLLRTTFTAPPSITNTAGARTMQLTFTAPRVARFTNGLESGDLIFATTPTLTPLSVLNQTLVQVDGTDQGQRTSFALGKYATVNLKSGVTNAGINYAYTVFSPLGALLKMSNTNGTRYLFTSYITTNYGTVYEESYNLMGSNTVSDLGLFGWTSRRTGGNAPTNLTGRALTVSVEGASYKWFFESATRFAELSLTTPSVTNDTGSYLYSRKLSDPNVGDLVLDSDQHGASLFTPTLQFISPSFAIFWDATTNVVGTAVLK